MLPVLTEFLVAVRANSQNTKESSASNSHATGKTWFIPPSSRLKFHAGFLHILCFECFKHQEKNLISVVGAVVHCINIH